MRVLILRSQDGAEYIRPVLFPDEWTFEMAADVAEEAIIEGQRQTDLWEFEWEDHIEPELVKRGFVVPDWNFGPNYDTERRPEVGDND